MKFSKLLIITMFLQITAFTIAVLVIFLLTGSEPSALVERFFWWYGTEGVCLMLIKTSDTRNECRRDIAKGREQDDCSAKDEPPTDSSASERRPVRVHITKKERG